MPMSEEPHEDHKKVKEVKHVKHDVKKEMNKKEQQPHHTRDNPFLWGVHHVEDLDDILDGLE
jgi:hypothetical protein